MRSKRHNEAMSVFDQIRDGLEDAVSNARGDLNLRTTTLPAPHMSKARVVAVRKSLKVSQSVFAAYLNVPVRTLQSWEQGLRTPKAGEARILQICESAPEEFMGRVKAAGAVVGRGRSRRSARASSRT